MEDLGRFVSSITRTSDVSFEYICTPCSRNDKDAEGTHFCQQCQEYFCKSCIDFHTNFPGLKDHRVIEQKYFHGKMMTTPRSAPKLTDHCEAHAGELITMYCPDHDHVICSVCVAIDHSQCIDIQYIPKAVKGFSKSPQIKEIKQGMVDLHRDLAKTKEARQRHKANITEENAILVTAIQDFRGRINAIFDQLEKEVMAEVETRKKELEGEVEADINTCTEITDNLQHILEQLDAMKQDNDLQYFIEIKKGKKLLTKGKQINEMVSASIGRNSVRFSPDLSLENDLKKLRSIGRLQPDYEHGIDCLDLEQPTPETVGKTSQTTLYKVTTFDDYNVRTPDDENNCYIWGSCQLSDGTILLSDCANNKLKQLDPGYKVIGEYDLPGAPWGVCATGPQEVAVCINDGISGSIQFVSTFSRNLTSSFSLGEHWGYGIAFSDGELFIGDDYNQIGVYNKQGDSLRTVYRGSDLQHIAVCDDGKTIYVADSLGGVILLDRNGQVICRFTDPDLSHALGVSSDGTDNLFVSDYNSGNILQLNNAGVKQGIILTKQDDVEKPTSLCFDRATRTLIVAMQYRDTLRMFKLKQ